MTAYLNGRFLPLAKTRISPLDRGFLYADGAYETIPAHSRHPFRVDAHLSRLRRSRWSAGADGLPNARMVLRFP
jgi:D-alanine transaminase